MKNLEIKATCSNPIRAQETAHSIGARFVWSRQQIDTYFPVPHGKLKLRETDSHAELIAYSRPERSEARTSHYHITPVTDSVGLLNILKQSLGIDCIVQKKRTLYVWHSVRIHLDQVEQLGSFIEFEAVLTPQVSETQSRHYLDRLFSAFDLGTEHIIACGYYELLKQTQSMTEQETDSR
jgi:predicted adenylyl cyclase CyaB